MASDANGPAGALPHQPLQLRDCLVVQEGECDPEYSIGELQIEGQPGQSLAVVGVATIGDRVLVAIPEAAWNRRKALRVLPVGSLTKAINVSVQCAYAEERDTQLDETYVRTWLGFLNEEFVEQVTFPERVEADLVFGHDPRGRALVPFGEALYAVANDHFAFVTAESGAGALEGGDKIAPELEARFSQIEAGIRAIQDALRSPGASPLSPGPPAPATPAAPLEWFSKLGRLASTRLPWPRWRVWYEAEQRLRPSAVPSFRRLPLQSQAQRRGRRRTRGRSTLLETLLATLSSSSPSW